jgi:hypothetical protein
VSPEEGSSQPDQKQHQVRKKAQPYEAALNCVVATDDLQHRAAHLQAAPSSEGNGVPPAAPPAALVDSIEVPYQAPTGADKFWTSVKLAFALPWRRFKKGSVLTIKVRSFEESLEHMYVHLNPLPINSQIQNGQLCQVKPAKMIVCSGHARRQLVSGLPHAMNSKGRRIMISSLAAS